jgi:hypothetical protein
MSRRKSKPRSPRLPYEPRGDEYFDECIYGNMPLKFQLLAMLYLIEKHPNACVYLPDVERELTSDTPSFLSIAVQWWVATQKLYFPTRPKFWDFFEQCLKGRARFVIVYMVHDAEEIGLDNHMNILIYDKEENTFERFEPNSISPSPAYHADILDKRLERVFKSHGIRYIKPLDFCPLPAGIQMLQHREFKKRGRPLAGDIGGFCQSWSTFYADMRLSFPDVPRDQLLVKAIELFKGKSMSEYIRDYTYYVARRSRQIHNIEDYKKMALDSIKKNNYKYYAMPPPTPRKSTRIRQRRRSTSK